MRKILITLSCALLLLACKKDETPIPDDAPSLVGWAVGNKMSTEGALMGLMYKTVDGGKSWTPNSAPLQFQRVELAGVLAVSDQVCFVTGYHATEGGVIYKTTDGGATWQRKAAQLRIPELMGLGLFSWDGVHVFFCTDGFIYQSKDSGETWEKIPVQGTPADTPFFYGGHIVSADGMNIYVSGTLHDKENSDPQYAAVYYTRDAGKSWTLFNPGIPTNLINLSAASSDVLYFVGYHGFAAKTTDGCKTLKRLTNLEHNMNDNNGVYAFDEQHVITGIDYGIIAYTHDGGDHWTEAAIHMEGIAGYAIMRLCFLQDRLQGAAACISLSGSRGGAMIYTTDGGYNWHQASGIDPTYEFIDLAFVEAKRR